MRSLRRWPLTAKMLSVHPRDEIKLWAKSEDFWDIMFKRKEGKSVHEYGETETPVTTVAGGITSYWRPKQSCKESNYWGRNMSYPQTFRNKINFSLMTFYFYSPGFEDAWWSPTDVYIWEGQCGFWILQRFNMAFVHEQDHLLWLMVDDWQLCTNPKHQQLQQNITHACSAN